MKFLIPTKIQKPAISDSFTILQFTIPNLQVASIPLFSGSTGRSCTLPPTPAISAFATPSTGSGPGGPARSTALPPRACALRGSQTPLHLLVSSFPLLVYVFNKSLQRHPVHPFFCTPGIHLLVVAAACRVALVSLALLPTHLCRFRGALLGIAL